MKYLDRDMRKEIILLLIICISSLSFTNAQSSTTLKGTFLDPSSDTYMVNPYTDPNNFTDVNGYDFLDIVSFSYTIDIGSWQVSMSTKFVADPLLNASTFYFMQIEYKPLLVEYESIQFSFYVRGGKESASLQLNYQNGTQRSIDVSVTKSVSGSSMVLSATFSQLTSLSLTPLEGYLYIRSEASFDLDLNASSEEIQDVANADISGIVDDVQVNPQYQAVFSDNYSDVYKFNPANNPSNQVDFDGADLIDFIKVGFGYDPANWGLTVNGTFADNIVVNQSISYDFVLSFMLNSGNYKEVSFIFEFSSNQISFILTTFASNGTQNEIPAIGNYNVSGSSIEMKGIFPQLTDFSLPSVLTNVDGDVFLHASSTFDLDINQLSSDNLADNFTIQFFDINGTVTGLTKAPSSTASTNNGLPISLLVPITAIVTLKKKKK